jgi:hypothetical protein
MEALRTPEARATLVKFNKVESSGIFLYHLVSNLVEWPNLCLIVFFFFEKMKIILLVKKFFAFYETLRTIAVFTANDPWSLS